MVKPWGRALHSICLSSMSPAGCATCWSMTLFHFGPGFLPMNTLAWEDQSNENLGHNWSKILREKMGMEARRFPVKWCDGRIFLWPCCWFTPVWYKNDNPCPPLMFTFLNCLSFQPSGRNSSSPLLKAKTRTRPSLLCERRGTKIPSPLYKDLKQNNSRDCCRSRLGRKQITP